ncbi:MAG: hypothetical protein OEZ58_17755 [Gammaproteobacteria bacterium]|nr:hypothetical protein [Gammaproteobacteria bacterium]MDH5730838.1 hypothetical protein [Gammaproteobacteria bacterium]
MTDTIMRPRVITQIFLPEEEPDKLSAQLVFLNQLKHTHHSIFQVAGHDNRQIEDFVELGLMKHGF